MPTARALCRPIRRQASRTWLRYRLRSAPPPCECPSRGTRAGCEARSPRGWRSGSFQTSPALPDHEQRLAILDRLAVLDQDGLHDTGDVGLDFIHQLHRLDDADRVALLYGLPDFDECFR